MAAPRRRNKPLWDYAALVAGTGVGPALALAISPVLTRLFNPAEIGEYAVFVALLGIDVMVCLGYERAILLPREPQTRLDVVLGAIGASLVCALLSAGALLVFGSQIAVLLGKTELGATTILLPLGLFASGCLQALTGWHIAEGRLGRISLSRFVQAVTAAAGQVLWGALGGGAIGLAGAQCIGLAAGGGTLLRDVRSQAHAERLRIELSRVRAALFRYRYFLMSSVAALMNAATIQLPLLVLSARFGIVTAGWIGLAQRVGGGTLNLLVTAASQVFSSRVIQPIHQGNRREVARLYRGTVLTHAAIALPALLLIPVTPAIFAFVFGDEWREAGVVTQILAVALAAQFIFSPVYGVLNLLERQGMHLMVEAARLVLLGSALFVGFRKDEPLQVTLVYVAAASAFGYVLAGTAAFLAIRNMAERGKEGEQP